jgi:hypothetical protein
MSILYAVLIVSTIVLVVLGIVLFMRVRRLSRASNSQFSRLVRDEETAAKSGTNPH